MIDDSGTGDVHRAPAFGEEDDYRLCTENQINFFDMFRNCSYKSLFKTSNTFNIYF